MTTRKNEPFVPKHVFYKTKSIFEKLTNSKIILQIYKGLGQSFVVSKLGTRGKKIFEVGIFPYRYNNWRLGYRVLTHELSHILFESYRLDPWILFLSKKLDIPKTVVEKVIGFFEDYRIDYLYSKLYSGAKTLDTMLNSFYRNTIDPNTDNIFEIMKAVLTNNDDIFALHGNQYAIEVAKTIRQLLKKLENKDHTATVLVTLEFLNKYAETFKKFRQPELIAKQEVEQVSAQTISQFENITLGVNQTSQVQEYETEKSDEEEEKKKDEAEHKQKGVSGSEEESDEDSVGSSLDQEAKTEESQNDTEDSVSSDNESDETESMTFDELMGQVKDNVQNNLEVLTEMERDLQEYQEYRDFDDKVRNYLPLENLDLEEYEGKTLEELHQEAEERMEEKLQEITEKLKRYGLQEIREEKGIIGRVVIDPSSFISHYHCHEPLPEVSKKLSTFFKRIRGKLTMQLSDSGIEIDLDEEIQSEFNPSVQDVFLCEEYSQGLHIVILLDASGSMMGNKMSMAASVCLTLYQSLKQLPNVEFKVIAFSASDNAVYLAELSEDELKRVVPMYLTPTHAAVRYACNLLESKSGKRVIIIITDGTPELDKVDNTVAAKWTKAEINRARRKGIEVYTFFISPKYDDRTLRDIFGPQFTWEVVFDIEQLPRKLFSFVSQKVAKTLLRGG
jgi:uncharacterized protein YegL